MNDDDQAMPVSADDLVAYAIDAHDLEDAGAVAAHLHVSPDASRKEKDLRSAAGEFAATVVNEVAPPATLRSRVLREAGLRRPSVPVVAGASPIDVHRVELARAVLLVRDLAADDWDRSVDPPEFAGWTVHDVAVHLAANQSLLAFELGVPVRSIPETATDNEGRTAQARARHADLPPAHAVAELEACAAAVDTEVVARGEDRLDALIEWWGVPTTTRIALLVRAFETWTHADDIRRAVGADVVEPPPASLLTMAHTACGFVPMALAARETSYPGSLVRFRFDDLGDAAWDVDLAVAGSVRPAGDSAVDAEIVVAAAAFCRGMTGRVAVSDLAYDAHGDAQLVRDIVDALPALAVL
jgi:uncharacterized protein (TIGR03083 family)